MNENKLTAVLALLISTHIGLAYQPLDTWTWRNPLPPPLSLIDIAYGEGQFVAVGESGIILTSADGVNWNVRQSGTHDGLVAIAYGNGQFVAVGSTYDGPSPIWTAGDGVNWV